MTKSSHKKTHIFENGPIEKLSWGKFIIDGSEHYLMPDKKRAGAGKDIRLIGRKTSPWAEREGHVLSRQMLTGIFEQGIDILIIGTGIKGDIQVSEQVIEDILSGGIKQLFVEKTPEACRLYNDFFHEGKNVALLAHATC